MGNLVEMLHRSGVESYGIEISDYALAQVPQDYQTFCQKGDLLNLPFGENQFDVVVTVNVLEHIATQNIKQAITESARVARFGLYHEITVLEDTRTIGLDSTHVTKENIPWWEKILNNHLGKRWDVQRGITIPFFKHGIFILRRKQNRPGLR